MSDLSGNDGDFVRQKAIRARCVHPTGTFIRFEEEEIEQSIPARFEQQVLRYSDCLAVKTRKHEFTYDELNKAANRVASAILEQRGGEQEPVALLFEHGAHGIIAILGALKAGKFYVPLNNSHPYARASGVLEDSQAALMVTNNKNLAQARSLAQDTVHLLNIDELDPGLSTENPGLSIPPDAYAYIIYTSGTTGQPKGVIGTHRNLLHFVMILVNGFHTCSEDRISLLFRSSFSGSLTDIFSALLNGAALFPFDISEEGIDNLADWLIREEITKYESVPMVFRQFTDTLTGTEEFPKLRIVGLGGDRMYKTDVELYKKHFSPNCIMQNGVGATEIQVTRRYFIDKETQIAGSIVPTGYEVEDTEVLLLDDGVKVVGTNQVGEIVIRSRYMSPGYWRRPDLTEAKFRPDTGEENERLYYTGDLGTMTPDGCLTYLGRKDFQVKIRGVRIEVGAIEATLLDLDIIKEAVVVAREDRPGDQYLVAYVVPTLNHRPTLTSLRRALSERLPDYMIPSVFMILDAMPLNHNGKVDRQALPIPDRCRPELETSFAPPRTPVEETLVEIWGEVLDLNEVGIHDSFFELGGHSLLASRIISRVIETFQVKVSLHSLFQSPTVADMAGILVHNMAEKAESGDIERLLAELAELPDDEVKMMLDDEGS
ncbi:amino acid adenylation domain-containing protein [Candidatus Poribacteria bacterium]